MATNQYLTRGSDYLAEKPDFKLIGRDLELERLTAILMRNDANSILLVGPGGVGCTALCLGLQARKSEPDAPFDIVTKRLYWLNVDELFSSADNNEINKNFTAILKKMKNTTDSILIIEDTRDFIEACRNSGCSHFINSLNAAVKNGDTQAILEIRDDDLDFVLKSHSDMRECYTMMDVNEPANGALFGIISSNSASLVRHHGINITEDAIKTAIEVTTKYRTKDLGLSRAQPERSSTLLDRALASYRLEAHKQHPDSLVLLQKLATTTDETARAAILAELQEKERIFLEIQNEIRRLFKLQREGEEAVHTLYEEIEEINAQKKENADKIVSQDDTKSMIAQFGASGGFDVKEVAERKQMIAKFEAEIAKNKEKFNQLTGMINDRLSLTRDLVLMEFSKISGIAANKLSENEREKLIHLEDDIKKRIYGQDHAVNRLVNAVKTARIGRRNNDKPQAAFMFLGPSGVGKTEIAKALAASLLDDEGALTRFDMSEYMERHAVAKLIGAPPGYEGFEAGGILTNAMRKNPNRILLFDEIEKAHDDVFNIFLQILSDGRLTDNVGRTVSFADAIILMTTNIGQTHFLNEELSEEEADNQAFEELGTRYRSEFLNRFAGRQNIVCFKRLGINSIEKIVRREIQNLDDTYSEKSVNIEMGDEALKLFCRDHYNPMIGARGLPGYIQATLEPVVVNAIIDNPNFTGTFDVGYDTEKQTFSFKMKE